MFGIDSSTTPKMLYLTRDIPVIPERPKSHSELFCRVVAHRKTARDLVRGGLVIPRWTPSWLWWLCVNGIKVKLPESCIPPQICSSNSSAVLSPSLCPQIISLPPFPIQTTSSSLFPHSSLLHLSLSCLVPLNTFFFPMFLPPVRFPPKHSLILS